MGSFTCQQDVLARGLNLCELIGDDVNSGNIEKFLLPSTFINILTSSNARSYILFANMHLLSEK